MSRDVTPALSAVVDNLMVTGGGLTNLPFRYVPWGRHRNKRDPDYPAAGEGLVTIAPVSNPHKASDTGAQAAQNRQTVDVHFLFEDDAGMTSPDLFKAAVANACDVALRAARASFGQGYWFTEVANVIDATGWHGTGSNTIVYEVIVQVSSRGVEVY